MSAENILKNVIDKYEISMHMSRQARAAMNRSKRKNFFIDSEEAGARNNIYKCDRDIFSVGKKIRNLYFIHKERYCCFGHNPLHGWYCFIFRGFHGQGGD